MRALRPGLATIPGAMLLIASSPYAKRGELYNAFRKHFGKDDAKVLVWKAATLAMHPTLELMRHDASCGVNGKRRTPNRSDCAPYDFRVSPRQRPVRVELTRSTKPSINDRYLRIVFSNGSRRKLFGCRRFRVPAFSACSFGT
jgi:hypothetical protein